MSRRKLRQPPSAGRSAAGPPTPARPATLPQPSRWLDAAAAGALAFAVYCLTLSRSVNGGDSGELISAAFELGLPHPPGYPLFVLLGHAWLQLFPAAEAAFAMNLLSALLAAASVAGMSWLVLTAVAPRYAHRHALAAATAMLFALSPAAWRCAVTAEVFSLNSLIVVLALYFAGRWERTRSRANLWLFSLVAGTGLAHHHLSALVTLPLGALICSRGWRLGKRLDLATALALGLLPLGLYAYLPWCVSHEPLPLGIWGLPVTGTDVLHHFLRSDYGTLQLTRDGSFSAGDALARFWRFFVDLGIAPLGVGFVVLLFGLYAGLRRPASLLTRAVAISFVLSCLLLAAVSNVPEASGLARFVEERVWIQPTLLGCLLMAAGLAELAEALPWLRSGHPAFGWLLATAVAGVQFGRSWHANDYHHDTVTADYASAILDAAAPNAILVVNGDATVFGLRYLQVVEGRRPDVIVMPQFFVSESWYWESMQRRGAPVRLPEADREGVRHFTIAELVRLQLEQQTPVYSVNALMAVLDNGGDQMLDFEPLGVAERIVLKAGDPSGATAAADWYRSMSAALARVPFHQSLRDLGDEWDRQALRNVNQGLLLAGARLVASYPQMQGRVAALAAFMDRWHQARAQDPDFDRFPATVEVDRHLRSLRQASQP